MHDVFILNLEYNHVDKLKVYPFDISTIQDLMLTAIITISAEVVIRLYFHFAGLQMGEDA